MKVVDKNLKLYYGSTVVSRLRPSLDDYVFYSCSWRCLIHTRGKQ